MAFFLILLHSKWTWILGGAAALLFLLWLQFGGAARSWWAGLPQAREEAKEAIQTIQETRDELARTQGAVREMSRQIMELTQEANRQKAAAQKAAGDAKRWEGTAAQLATRVRDLDSARRALPPVSSIDEAIKELKQHGY